jgi:hypothetical protein
MQRKSYTLFRRSVSLSLSLLLAATTLPAQPRSGASSLHDVMEYEPWQHGLLVTLFMGTIALAVIFALHNRKSRKLIDMHRSLKAKLHRPSSPPKKSSRTVEFGKPPASASENKP